MDTCRRLINKVFCVEHTRPSPLVTSTNSLTSRNHTSSFLREYSLSLRTPQMCLHGLWTTVSTRARHKTPSLINTTIHFFPPKRKESWLSYITGTLNYFKSDIRFFYKSDRPLLQRICIRTYTFENDWPLDKTRVWEGQRGTNWSRAPIGDSF